jgi:ribose transport system permease protein
MSTETEVLVPPQNGAEPDDRPNRGTAARWLRWAAATPEVGVIVLCVLVFAAIAAKTGDYAHTGNLQVMGRDLAQVGILAIGESMVILTGGIDLSVGALAGFAAWRSCSRW